jgi:hypothetical protein
LRFTRGRGISFLHVKSLLVPRVEKVFTKIFPLNSLDFGRKPVSTAFGLIGFVPHRICLEFCEVFFIRFLLFIPDKRTRERRWRLEEILNTF